MRKHIHVLIATGKWDQDNLRYRRHRFAEFLQRHPDTKEVIWVCPTSDKQTGQFQKLANGIVQYTVQDIHPHKIFRFGRYFDSFYKTKLAKLREYLNSNMNDHLNLWFTFPGFPAMLDLVKWDKTTYDCSDLWASSITGNHNMVLKLREKSIASAERRIVTLCNNIICTSDYLHDNLIKRYQVKKLIHVLENGVEYHLFNQALESEKKVKMNGQPTLGFIGGIKPKLDFHLLRQVMELREDWKLLLVGPDGTNMNTEFKDLLSLPNVTYTGKVSPQEVPIYMGKIDIGILPYKASEYNNAVFPLKLFEYLAAEKPVVGINLPSTKKYAQPGVFEYLEKDDPRHLIAACEEFIFNNSMELFHTRKELAKEHDWAEIFCKMYQITMKK
ncbi:MAG TPA: glycosyltransferase [Niallia sp.]|nr:glycosyltransferase [Niallia sp.]